MLSMAKNCFALTGTKSQHFNFMENNEYCQHCGSDQMPINEQKCRDCGGKYYEKNQHTNNMKETPRHKGIQDARKRVEKEKNPYAPQSQEFIEWESGWHEYHESCGAIYDK